MLSNIFLQIDIEPLDQGGYLATSPDLPGFLVEGQTIDQVLRETPIVAQALLETYRELGKPVPDALTAIPTRLTVSVPMAA